MRLYIYCVLEMDWMRAWLSLRLNSERKGRPNNKVESVHASCGPSTKALHLRKVTYSQTHTRFVLLTEIHHIGRLGYLKNGNGAPCDNRYGG